MLVDRKCKNIKKFLKGKEYTDLTQNVIQKAVIWWEMCVPRFGISISELVSKTEFSLSPQPC